MEDRYMETRRRKIEAFIGYIELNTTERNIICTQVWRELLIGASDDVEGAYMLDLIKAASKNIKDPVELKIARN